MAIAKVLQNFSSNVVVPSANKVFSKVGTAFEQSKGKDTFNKLLEPVGANNKFLTLAGLMVACVITPRIITALKRNPDNKEATKDEIKEILFRDVQSVLVVLFMLKALNAIIAGKITKISGLPMTNKPYEKLFNSSLKSFGEKFQDFVNHPIDKLKKIGRNILNTLHPTEGVRAKTNNEYVADYSNYPFKKLPEFFDNITKQNGDSKKVFNKIIKGTIEEYENILHGTTKKGKTYGVDDFIKIGLDKNGVAQTNLELAKNNAKATIEALKELQGKGPEVLSEIDNKAVQSAIENYLKNKDNSLVMQGKGANGWLRLGALAIEASYLGFGIPALNQLRLEKKYLKEDNNDLMPNTSTNKYDGSLISKNIKAHQIKLYHNFIK